MMVMMGYDFWGTRIFRMVMMGYDLSGCRHAAPTELYVTAVLFSTDMSLLWSFVAVVEYQ